MAITVQILFASGRQFQIRVNDSAVVLDVKLALKLCLGMQDAPRHLLTALYSINKTTALQVLTQVRSLVGQDADDIRMQAVFHTGPYANPVGPASELQVRVQSVAASTVLAGAFQQTDRVEGVMLQLFATRGIPPRRSTLMVPNGGMCLHNLTRLGEIPTETSGDLTLILIIGSRTCAWCDSCAYFMQKCGACGTVHYCSQVCQHAHWPAHRLECRQ